LATERTTKNEKKISFRESNQNEEELRQNLSSAQGKSDRIEASDWSTPKSQGVFDTSRENFGSSEWRTAVPPLRDHRANTHIQKLIRHQAEPPQTKTSPIKFFLSPPHFVPSLPLKKQKEDEEQHHTK